MYNLTINFETKEELVAFLQNKEAAPKSVPTTSKTYSLEELQVAAAPLLNTKQADLLALLKEFNVPSLTELPANVYDAFALKLRGLGATI